MEPGLQIPVPNDRTIAPRYESRKQLAIVASYLDRRQTVWHSFVVLNGDGLPVKKNILNPLLNVDITM
jgi:hypothetical protein